MRNHRKVKMIRNKFGSVLGYAFWCMMLEWLTEHDGLEGEFSEIEIEMFASELGVSATEIPPLVDYCIKIGLLFKTDSDFVYSESLHEFLQPLFEKRNRERQRSKERQRKEDGTFLPKKSTSEEVSVAETPRSIVIDSIVIDRIDSNTPAEPQGQVELPLPKTVPMTTKEQDFIKLFNSITNRKFEKLDTKAQSQFKARLKEGNDSKKFRKAIEAAYHEMSGRNTVNYLTPEFITRSTEFSKYYNMPDVVEKPLQARFQA